MNLYITPARMIAEVQKEFNTQFPFLKLEFFRNRPSRQVSLSPKDRVMHNCKIGELQSAITDGDLEIKEDMKVIELEKNFKDDFGLFVQVFRCSGNLWLETTMTDNWTLRQQNEHGREISSGDTKKILRDADEYDLNRDAGH